MNINVIYPFVTMHAYNYQNSNKPSICIVYRCMCITSNELMVVFVYFAGDFTSCIPCYGGTYSGDLLYQKTYIKLR